MPAHRRLSNNLQGGQQILLKRWLVDLPCTTRWRNVSDQGKGVRPMKPGDRVWNAWHGLLRFGEIKSQSQHPDGWTYFTVQWQNDSAYEARIAHRKNLTHRDDHGLAVYRADQIHPVNQG